MTTINAKRSDTALAARGGSEVFFEFEGHRLAGREGDSVAAALIANGLHVFGRSWKYHRPRGYRCGYGHCSSCAMRVDGLPGVRTCVTTIRSGMKVEREHSLPNADHDVLQAAGFFSPLMPPGFYYRWFRHSPRLWGAFERGLAQISGQGDMPSPEAIERLRMARCARRQGPDVLVVGGGVAGMSAALAAADAGSGVLLVEQDDRLGGRVVITDSSADVAADQAAFGHASPRDADLVGRLAALALAHERVEVLTSAAAFGWYDEGIVAIDRQPDLLLVSPAAVVLATGGYDRGLPFAGWDLPGVMLAAGAERLLRRYELRPGSRAVVVTTNDLGYELSRQLSSAGIEIACVADARPRQAVVGELLDEATRTGTPVLTGASSAQAHGFSRVSALSLRLDDREGRLVKYACDLVCLSAGTRPADDLAYQALSRGSIVLSVEEPIRGVGGPLLAGLVAGALTLERAIDQGRTAGSAAATQAGREG